MVAIRRLGEGDILVSVVPSVAELLRAYTFNCVKFPHREWPTQNIVKNLNSVKNAAW
jgi:hypothetical protein